MVRLARIIAAKFPHHIVQRGNRRQELLWNILYSDEHIGSIEEKELLKELEKLATLNPDVLKVLQILNDPNNENREEISNSLKMK
ncbi:MAG: hypothetical protein JXA96_07015 [Sedimentisphaerales bacterium]|nr:hypothetical protein [Sedimentisphaerales bacterium]